MAGCASPTAAGVVIAAIRERTPAARAGLRPGDRIVTINGEPLRDVIDFHFHAGVERLRLSLERGGKKRDAVLRRTGPDLGLELEAPRPGEIDTCSNKCVFCFIHQLPRGMRKSLYVKDDDFRLSFLHGNYITLTDLEEHELERIEEQRLSPLYVSVHATDSALRHRLLGAPRIRRELLPVMERLAKAGIVMHAQIVLVPEWNDGAHLERSVRELRHLHPGVATVAVVPVGLTRHRERLPQLRTHTALEARALASAIAGWQREFLDTLGTRFVWASDEVYLQAGLPLPSAASYEGFPVIEDGVGLVRRFTDGFAASRRRLTRPLPSPRAVTVVTGTMFAPRMRALLDGVRVDGLSVAVIPVVNDCFGHGIGVAGLLTGEDIRSQLAGQALGDEVLVPQVTLSEKAGVFLDDLSLGDVSDSLGVPVRAVDPSAGALVTALLGR
jgi:putative radical SAM enzyme (TIGR03279 family)